ncbi:MAG: hypothetical protein ABL967_19100 [Bryobacteraceae bacterium]
MNIQFAVTKKSCYESQSVTGNGLIDERLLPLQGLHRAATWGTVLVYLGVANFGKEFAGCAKPICASWIAPVPGLTQDELASVGSIPKVEPVRDCCVTAD